MSDRDHAVGLHGRLTAALAERDALRAERDRLARILAVERGDESAAPEGWRRKITGAWWQTRFSPGASVIRLHTSAGPVVQWAARGVTGGDAATLLEGMMLADKAIADLFCVEPERYGICSYCGGDTWMAGDHIGTHPGPTGEECPGSGGVPQPADTARGGDDG